MNRAEKTVATRMEKEGWTVINTGWPDFLLIKFENGMLKGKAVEVKSINRNDSEEKVMDHQWDVLYSLATLGLSTSVIWEDGVERKVAPLERYRKSQQQNFDGLGLS